MPVLRLVNAQCGAVQEFEFGSEPKYMAISHTWAEGFFPQKISFLQSPGGKILHQTLERRGWPVLYCWIDTLCINQDCEQDKIQQIPLMGQIYTAAEAGVAIMNQVFGLLQVEIDELTKALRPAYKMAENETWKRDGSFWREAEGREIIIKAMKALAILVRSEWVTRVWTLQEYILSRRFLWLSVDGTYLEIKDWFFETLPILCDGLTISECLRGVDTPYTRIYSHLSGMAAARMGKIDQSRIMELLGNRITSVPQDEIFGAMGVAGLAIRPDYTASPEQIWQLWCKSAIKSGHIRWALLPNSISSVITTFRKDCITPEFHTRHRSSAGSELDSVQPLEPVTEQDGTIKLTGHRVGRCSLLRRLGKVVEDQSGVIHRDVTLILFSDGVWSRARQIAQAFGGGRYNPNQITAITAVLCLNFAQAIRCTCSGSLPSFRLGFQNRFQQHAWEDFMQLQMSMMSPVQNGVAYLIEVRNQSGVCLTATSLTRAVSECTMLEALHFNAKTIDDRFVLMLAQKTSPESSFHKVGTTLPISIRMEPAEGTSFNTLVVLESPTEFLDIGGDRCSICHRQPLSSQLEDEPKEQARILRLEKLLRREKGRKRFDARKKRTKLKVRLRRHQQLFTHLSPRIRIPPVHSS